MGDNKINKFLLITTILSVMALTLGATFSFFTISNRSDVDAVTVEAGRISLGLGISELTTHKKLIPTNDDDIMTAYDNKCVDDNGYGACSIFEFVLSNFDSEQDIIGKINFSVENIENLKYMVLDENDDIYVETTNIANGESYGLSLGEHFVMTTGTAVEPTTRIFKLVVWLSNLDTNQNDNDAGGTFTAICDYRSVLGGMLTGSVNGIA